MLSFDRPALPCTRVVYAAWLCEGGSVRQSAGADKVRYVEIDFVCVCVCVCLFVARYLS